MTKKKFCKYCNKEKLVTDFYPTDHSSDGYMNKCKECSKAYSRQYHIDNADKIRKKHRGYYEKNIDKIKAYDKNVIGKTGMKS